MLGAWRPHGTCVHADRIQACPNACPRRATSSLVLRIRDIWMLGRTGQPAWELRVPSVHLWVALKSKPFPVRALLLSRMILGWNALLTCSNSRASEAVEAHYCRSLTGCPHSRQCCCRCVQGMWNIDRDREQKNRQATPL